MKTKILLIVILFLALGSLRLVAQPCPQYVAPTCAGCVAVQQTLYSSPGVLANGSLTISWATPFTAPDGNLVVPGCEQYNVIRGIINVLFEPNVGSSPAGTYYTVTYNINGSLIRTQEFWVIPGSGPVNIAAVRTIPAPSPSFTIALSQIAGAMFGYCPVGSNTTPSVWVASVCPGGGGGVWGTITGTLSAQTDLNTALNARLIASNNLSDIVTPATARTNLGLGTIATKTQTSGTIVLKGDGSGGFANATGLDIASRWGGTGCGISTNSLLVDGINCGSGSSGGTGTSTNLQLLYNCSNTVCGYTVGIGLLASGGSLIADTSVIATNTNVQSTANNIVTLTSSSTSVLTGTMRPTLLALTNNQLIGLTWNAICAGGAMTLKIDSLSAYALKLSDGSTNLATTDCAIGTTNWFSFDGVLNVFKLASVTPTSQGTGITQLTGDVTAGPGSGSQVSTIGAAKVAPAMMKASTFDAQTDGATITWAIASVLNAQATVTLGGNRTLNITNPVIGGNYVFRIAQDGTGTRTLTPGTGCTWKVVGGTGGGTFPLSTAANAVDVLAFIYDGTSCLATVGKAYASP